jgi:hypothetical protein
LTQQFTFARQPRKRRLGLALGELVNQDVQFFARGQCIWNCNAGSRRKEALGPRASTTVLAWSALART